MRIKIIGATALLVLAFYPQAAAKTSVKNTVQPFLISKEQQVFPNYTDNYQKTIVEPREAAQKALEEQARILTEQKAQVVYTASTPVYSTNVGGLLAKIKMCESGGNYANMDTGHNGHWGAYQFDFGTWASVGGSGNPANASPSEQDMRAQLLFNLRGTGPWEASRYCWQL